MCTFLLFSYIISVKQMVDLYYYNWIKIDDIAKPCFIVQQQLRKSQEDTKKRTIKHHMSNETRLYNGQKIEKSRNHIQSLQNITQKS